jgi:hypothetical protein
MGDWATCVACVGGQLLVGTHRTLLFGLGCVGGGERSSVPIGP